MNNENIEKNQRIEQEKVPKWPIFIFKLLGIFLMIGGVLFVSINLSRIFLGWSLLIIELGLFKAISLLIGMICIAVLLLLSGYGCWELKKWIIPLFGINVISTILDLIIKAFIRTKPLSFLQLILPSILFSLAYFYRRYFTGSYKAYPIYVIYGLAIIFILLISFSLNFRFQE